MKFPFHHSIIATVVALACAPLHAAAPSSDLQDFARGRILVEPRAGLSDQDFDGILKVHGGKRRKLGQSNLHIVDLPGNASETAVIERLSRNPHIKFAELDRRIKPTMDANDPYAGSEWHLAKVGATTARNSTQGAGVTIAILDSGVDVGHPDLAPNLVAGYNMYSNNTDVSDVCGHGTAVAGTAAAATNNGIGVAGVAGNAKIMPVRIAFYDSLGCGAYTSTIANGITYAADHGARIANVSYGNMAGSASIQSAGNYLKSKGGLLIVSAGNTGGDLGVAPTSSMMVVSATDTNDSKASWSSYGSVVTLAAPGTGIWTTSNGSSYGAWNGTSFASPLAAGVAALMMSAAPSLSGSQIESLMYSTAVDVGAAGRDPLYGYGRVDAAAGVQAAINMVATVDTQKPTAAIVAPLGSSSVSGLVPVSATAADNVGVVRVDLKVNGTVVASATTAPFDFSWDSAGVTNGMANLVAVAWDAAGNQAASAAVAVNVANPVVPKIADTTPPVVAISNPVAGAVSGNVSVKVSASDNSGAAGISQRILVDGKLAASGTGGSLSYNWNTRKIVTGAHTVQAIATDAAGNTSSASVTVTVSK